MNIEVSQQEIGKILALIAEHVASAPQCTVKYLALGVSTIRVLCGTPDILPILERQLTYVLRDEAEHYDGTIIVLHGRDIDPVMNDICSVLAVRRGVRVRAELLWAQKGNYPFDINLFVEGAAGSAVNRASRHQGLAELFDPESRTSLFCCDSYEPEKFVKYGHVFVHEINRIIKSENVNLTHGAAFGAAGNGFLLCGRGKRGKSTLTVESMLQGFEYVSDDYQIIQKTDEGLFAYPIYSIVTLSYRMYNEMYDRFRGKFVNNNFQQDKYVFNIAAYHGQFRTAYPMRFCLFPEITSDEHPGIAPCSPEDKGRAIVHLLHSTLIQMGDLGEAETVRKLFLMVRDMPFVKFRLCNNIPENTDHLRSYLQSMPALAADPAELPAQLLDITYDLVTILDTGTFRFTEMNKFASNVFMLLLGGAEPRTLREKLAAYADRNPAVLTEFDRLMELIQARGYSSFSALQCTAAGLNDEFAAECGYKLSVYETVGSAPVELIS